MALWKEINGSITNVKGNKPYSTEVNAHFKVITFIDEETNEEKTVIHLNNVSSEEDKKDNNDDTIKKTKRHSRQSVDLDEDSAKELANIINSVFGI